MLEAEKRLTTNQLMRDEDEYFELDEIHVPLALVERKKLDQRRQEIPPEQGLQEAQPKSTKKLAKGGEQISPEQSSQLYEPEYQEKQRFEHEQFLQDILKDGKGKNNGKRIAIIGEPGAGKTTLLRKIAFWVQENTPYFPILISLADLAETNSKQELLEQYLLNKWLKAALPYISPEIVEVTEPLKTELKKLYNQEQVWLLLDGVDEMPVYGEERLWAISNQLKGWVGQARVMLTCRLNAWEANRNVLADNFEIYRTLEFSYGDITTLDRVGEFIAKWFKRQPNLGHKLRQALDEPGKERIKDLAKNPLRLALLCSTWSLWREHGGLPDTKAKLYQKFVEKFYQWKSKEFPISSSQQEQLNRALGELAKLAIDQTVSRFRLKHSLVCKVLAQPDEGLFQLALQLGWLNKVGLAAESPDETVYAFWHPSFEEYFAALAVDNWHFFLNHVPQNPKQGIYRIFENQWKQVILLWLGRDNAKTEQKEEFIKALLEFDDRCNKFYWYRAYFLAATGIAEFKDCSLADKIVTQIVNWNFNDFDDPIKEAAKASLQQTLQYKAINALVKFIETTENNYTRTKVAESLGKIATGNQKAMDALVRIIETTGDDETRSSLAANTLREIGTENTTIIDTLVIIIITTEAEIIRSKYPYLWQSDSDNIYSKYAKILREIGRENQKIIDILVRIILTTDHEGSRRLSANILREIGTGNQQVIDSLVRSLETTENDNINWLVSVILEDIANNNQKAINALSRIIQTTKNWLTSYLAVAIIMRIDRDNELMVDALAKIIETPSNDGINGIVADSFKKINTDNKSLIDAVVIFLAVKSWNLYEQLFLPLTPAHSINKFDYIASMNPYCDDRIRSLAAQYLLDFSSDNPTAIAALIRIIDTTKDDIICISAVGSLGRIGMGNQEAIDALVRVLETTEDEYIRNATAKSLGKISRGNQKEIDALVRVLETTKDKDTRQAVVETLAKIATGNQQAIDVLFNTLKTTQDKYSKIGRGYQKEINVLVRVLETTKDEDTRQSVVETLAKIATRNQKAIDVLLNTLETTQDKYSRREKADYILNQIGREETQEAITALIKILDRTKDEHIRTLAADILGKISKGEQKAIYALLRTLKNTRKSYNILIVIEAIGKIGKGNKKAIYALVKILKSTEELTIISNCFVRFISMSMSFSDMLEREEKLKLDLISKIIYLLLFTIMFAVLAGYINRFIYQKIAESLAKIDPGNQLALDALIRVISKINEAEEFSQKNAELLKETGVGDQKLIDALVTIIVTTGNDDGCSLAADVLRKVLKTNEQYYAVISAFKPCLTTRGKSTYYRFNNCYEIIWEAAQMIPYPEFYKAWNKAN